MGLDKWALNYRFSLGLGQIGVQELEQASQ